MKKTIVHLLLIVSLSFSHFQFAAAQVVTQINAETRQEQLAQIIALLELIQELQAQLEQQQQEELPTQKMANSAELTVAKTEHIRGNFGAPVKIIVYTDYNCPFCSLFHQTLNQLIPQTFTEDQVAWVYRHMPLKILHPNSETVALAAECIAKYQGSESFWLFTDMYFSSRADSTETNSSRLLDVVLEETGLNTSQVNACISSRELSGEVESDSEQALRLGLQGAPTSYVVKSGSEPVLIQGSQSASNVAQILKQVTNSPDGSYDAGRKEWLPTAKAKAEGKINVVQVAPSTINIEGQLIPPAVCETAPQFEFVLKLGNGESKILTLDECKIESIDETVVLTPSLIPQLVELTLRQVDDLNNVWMNYTQSRIKIDSTNPLLLDIVYLSDQNKKG